MSFVDDAAGRSREALRLSTDIVTAFVSRNAVSVDALPPLISTVYRAVVSLDQTKPIAPMERPKPAVPVNRSILEDYIVCLEDGKRLKMLKRYLRTRYDLSPEDYRRRWGLPADYPMVAPAYAAKRSEFARQIGLGKGVRRGQPMGAV